MPVHKIPGIIPGGTEKPPGEVKTRHAFGTHFVRIHLNVNGRYAAFEAPPSYQAAPDRYDAVLFRVATSAIFGAPLLFMAES